MKSEWRGRSVCPPLSKSQQESFVQREETRARATRSVPRFLVSIFHFSMISLVGSEAFKKKSLLFVIQVLPLTIKHVSVELLDPQTLRAVFFLSSVCLEEIWLQHRVYDEALMKDQTSSLCLHPLRCLHGDTRLTARKKKDQKHVSLETCIYRSAKTEGNTSLSRRADKRPTYSYTAAVVLMGDGPDPPPPLSPCCQGH